MYEVDSLEGYKNKYGKFFEFENPYGFMIEELVNSLYEKDGQIQGNYLTAIGLFCYSEIIGREIMHYKNSGTNKEKFDKKKCFNLFLGEYMGYKDLLVKYKNIDIYDRYRSGLCHEYAIKEYKKGLCGPRGGVFVYYDRESIPKFDVVGVDTTKGILLSENNQLVFIVLPYLEDFISGIEKFLKEKSYK